MTLSQKKEERPLEGRSSFLYRIKAKACWPRFENYFAVESAGAASVASVAPSLSASPAGVVVVVVPVSVLVVVLSSQPTVAAVRQRPSKSNANCFMSYVLLCERVSKRRLTRPRWACLKTAG